MTLLGKMFRHLVVVPIYAAIASTPFLLAQDKASASGDTKARNVEIIVNELQNCPCWLYVAPNDLKTRKKITDTYLRLSIYDTSTIHAGVKKYLNQGGGYDLQEIGKVFSLIRVLFKLPQHYTFTGEPFSPLQSPVRDDGSVDLLWPYSTDASGHLVLTGGDGKFFFDGSLWNELADFDHLASRFPRRR